MKTARRHELQTNTLADWLGESLENAKPYAKMALGIVLAAIVLIAFYLVMSRRSAKEEERGWNRYFAAFDSQEPGDLDDVAKEFIGTPISNWANLALADRKFAEGTNDLFSDRAKANEALAAAVTHYREAGKGTDPLLQQRATFGLARCYESQTGQLDAARKEYQQVIDRWPDSTFADMAKSRLADIDRNSTKEFYDWFADARLPAPPGDEPGIPGVKPPVNLDGATDTELQKLHESLFESSEVGGDNEPDADATESGADAAEETSADSSPPEGEASTATPQ